MQKRFLGYLISGIGLVILALSVEPIYNKLNFMQKVSSDYLMFFGVSLAIIGVVLISWGKRGEGKKEVPIYQGKEIVGYRRI